MKFGVRECTNIVFRAKTDTMVGNTRFKKGQPVLYIDSAKTSTLEGAATTVYAQGGRGNARLIAWEGEKTLTFTVEDALLSPLGFSILSGAGLIDNEPGQIVHVHKIVQQVVEGGAAVETFYAWGNDTYTKTTKATIQAAQDYEDFAGVIPGEDDTDWKTYVNMTIPYVPYTKVKNALSSTVTNYTVANLHAEYPNATYIRTMEPDANGFRVDLADALEPDEQICKTAPIFIMRVEEDGSLKGMIETSQTSLAAGYTGNDNQAINFSADEDLSTKSVAVDFYVLRELSNGQSFELQIDAENFAGYFYVEADTLFRRQDNGVDMPAIITLPNVKIQSNFTFTMASSGDPSTFTFTMDAMPGYTYFDPTKKVLCVIQIIDASKKDKTFKTVMPHAGHGSTGDETQSSFIDYVANNEDSFTTP